MYLRVLSRHAALPSHVGVCPCGAVWGCGPDDLVAAGGAVLWPPRARCVECDAVVAVTARFPGDDPGVT